MFENVNCLFTLKKKLWTTNNLLVLDISKQLLDFAVVELHEVVFHFQTENTIQGIQSFMKQLKGKISFDLKSVLFCMEHTGIYNARLLDYLCEKHANVSLESGIQTKQSSA